MKLLYIILCGILLCSSAMAQQLSDTLKVPQVTIEADRLPLPVSQKTETIDSATLQQYHNLSLAEVLEWETGIFIKNYGPGGLASASFRGTNAGQVQIYWDDMPLNSVLLGETELSIIPVAFTSKIELYYGGSNLQNGSGGFGGGIKLINETTLNKGFLVNLTQQVGSFGTYTSSGGFSFVKGKINSQTQLFYKQAKNDFKFANIAKSGDPIERREHAKFKTKSIAQDFAFKISKENKLQLNIWATLTDREIPPVLFTSFQNEHQKDKLILARLAWEFIINKHLIEVASSYKWFYINYTNELAEINSTGINSHWLQKAAYTFSIPAILEIGYKLEHHFINGENYSYSSVKTRNQLNGTGYISYRPIKQITLSTAFRQEVIDGFYAPFLPSVGFNIKPLSDSRLSIKANYSRNFRYPSFNNLYWKPGGNEDLKPENGWVVESGLSSKLIRNKKHLNAIIISLTGYYMNIDNWVIWLPTNFGYWSPQNIKQVVSKGVEANLNLNFKIKQLKASISSNYHFNKAINQNAINSNDNSAGKQLIYQPLHQVGIKLSIDIKGFYFQYKHQYISERFITTDNTKALDHYNIGSLIIGKLLNLNRHTIQINFRIENIWNADYVNVVYRPLPGRAYFLTINYKFVKS